MSRYAFLIHPRHPDPAAEYRLAHVPAPMTSVVSGRRGAPRDATEDPAAFTPGGLSPYAAIVFLSASGDVLSDASRDARPGRVTG